MGVRTVIAAVATAASAIWTSAWTLPDGSKNVNAAAPFHGGSIASVTLLGEYHDLLRHAVPY
jgi:hypothetical protein